ncbi:MAG: acyloxyacyl hydrolase [Cytophagales bacterium]
MLRYTLLLCLFLIAYQSGAQKLKKENFFVGIEAGTGAIFKHSEQIAHISNANPRSFDFHLRYVLPGNKMWQQKMGLPSAGLVLTYTDMDNPQVLGNSYHLTSYLTFPIKDGNRLDFEFRLGVGATYASRKFDLLTNRKNNLYSTDFSGMAYLRFAFNYQLSEQLFLSNSFGLSHYSNGSYKLPNLGANILTFNIGTYYRLAKKPLVYENAIEDSIPEKKYLLNIVSGYGWKASFPISDDRFSIYTLIVQAEKKTKGVGSWLAGIDFNKNESLEKEQNYLFPDKEFQNDYRIAVLGGYSLNVGRLSALGQLGIYLYSPVDPPRPYYQKIGLRFRFIDQFHLGLNLKAHAGVADFVEYVITYKI